MCNMPKQLDAKCQQTRCVVSINFIGLNLNSDFDIVGRTLVSSNPIPTEANRTKTVYLLLQKNKYLTLILRVILYHFHSRYQGRGHLLQLLTLCFLSPFRLKCTVIAAVVLPHSDYGASCSSVHVCHVHTQVFLTRPSMCGVCNSIARFSAYIGMYMCSNRR